VRKGYQLEPLIFGGGHQRGMRSGTPNVPGIVGLGESCRLCYLERKEDEPRIATQRDRLQKLLQEKIPNLVVNGDVASRLSGNLHISIPGIPNSAVIARVRHKLAISTGSACSSGLEAPSHVLQALNLPSDVVEGALRIGIGKFTTDADIDQVAEILCTAVSQVEQALYTTIGSFATVDALAEKRAKSAEVAGRKFITGVISGWESCRFKLILLKFTYSSPNA
jgi:cysteine desulfurase